MKMTCSHLEDFEWAAAHRNMSLFYTAPHLYVVHALLPLPNGQKQACGAFNTQRHQGVIFDNHEDYIKWIHEDDTADLAVLTNQDGTRLFCTIVEGS